MGAMHPGPARLLPACLVALLALPALPAGAGPLDLDALRTSLAEVAARADGRFGACVREVSTGREACAAGSERFPLAGLAKAPAAVAVLAAVERRTFRLEEPVTVRRADLSAPPGPLAAKVGPQGLRTSVGDLLALMVASDDSTAADVLTRRVGGPAGVQSALDRRGVAGVRVDRDERTLRADSAGLPWDPALADEAAFARAAAAVPEAERRRLVEARLEDPRDTATPSGMADFFARMAQGRLLGPDGTRRLTTLLAGGGAPGRLKAGLAPGWRIAAKSGSDPSPGEVDAATNEAGLLTAPDGEVLAVAAFLSGSRKPPAERDALLAAVARAAVEAYRPDR